MSTTSAAATDKPPIDLKSLDIDPARGGASVLVHGRLKEQPDGSALNEGEFNSRPYASCTVEFWGGSCKLSLDPFSDSVRTLKRAKPGDTALFAVSTTQRSYKVGDYAQNAFRPDGKATLLHIRGEA